MSAPQSAVKPKQQPAKLEQKAVKMEQVQIKQEHREVHNNSTGRPGSLNKPTPNHTDVRVKKEADPSHAVSSASAKVSLEGAKKKKRVLDSDDEDRPKKFVDPKNDVKPSVKSEEVRGGKPNRDMKPQPKQERTQVKTEPSVSPAKTHINGDSSSRKHPKAESGHGEQDETKAKRRKKAEEDTTVWKWWEEKAHPDGVKWLTLEHSGPWFPPEYEPLPSSIKFYYDGKPYKLSNEAEEVASFYAKMLDHDYTKKEAFNKNFFEDWRKEMTSEERKTITDLKKCNFKEMFEYFKMKSEERKNMSKEEKLKLKEQNEKLIQEYGYCIMDGHRQRIGNFKLEPPGLFRGRGDHPKQGKLKKRITANDIIINIGKDVKVPLAPPGHKWKAVQHDNKVTWLACWVENIAGSYKYIMLNPTARLKGEKDLQKYETARKLKDIVDEIRRNYREDWKSKEMRIRQRAVALYFIDRLALRAGHEKEEGESADTVGCCSLRYEHIKLHQELDDQDYVVEFDFLGKDSIRYQNKVPVEKKVFKNLELFMRNKQPDDELFDRLTTQSLNKYLSELMEGLSAKVFRTFNASTTLQDQLQQLTDPNSSVNEKVLAYNRANRAVAILCNHQRSVPKTFSKTMENLNLKLMEKKKAVKGAKKELKELKAKYKDSRHEKDLSAYEKKKNQLERLQEQLVKLEISQTDKEENKDIALGTSKLNYLDPRISVAWCKKHDVPMEKIYNKTQREKFSWAIDMTDEDFEF